MGRIVTCGVCGYLFEVGDPTTEANHKLFHQKNSPSLPRGVRDMIRYWAHEKLQAAAEHSGERCTPKELEEVDVAKWVMMHMWYNASSTGYSEWSSRDAAFKLYEAEIRKRYHSLRSLRSNFIGVEGKE